MSEKLGEEKPTEEVEHSQGLAPAAKKLYSRLPRMGASVERDHAYEHFNEPEYTVWDVYNNEARKIDTMLVNDWKESLNSLLLFAAIFSAVLTAFIIESKKMLEQDSTELLANAAIFSIQHAGNLSNVPYIPPEFNATPTAISINCLLFASLGASLVVALLSVVALQWVVDYDAAITRGGSSPEDHARRRQFRYVGVRNWKMGEIIASLPLLLYSSVALFWAGAVQWMWSIHPTVGYVVAGGSAIAALLYAGTTLLAAIFVSAPFRTPLSRGIYWLFQPWLSLGRKLFSKIPNPLSLGSPFKEIPSFLHELFAESAFRHHVMRAINWAQANLLPHVTDSQREEQAASADDSLGEQAMCWLGGQLPLSADSHGRLLLLLRELLSHPPKQSISDASPISSLWPIFDFLGWYYLRKVLDGTLSEDDQEGLGLLLKCREVPEIKSMIIAEKYQPTLPSATYRTQYGVGITKTGGKPTVNATLLLARDAKETLFRTFANSPRPDVQTAAASALLKWGQNAGPRDAIWATIPSLIELLKDQDDSVRSAAASALGKFAEQAELCDALRVAISPLLERLKDQFSSVKSAAVSALGKLAEQAELHDAIRDAIPSLIELLKDQYYWVRSVAASTLGNLAEHAELRDALHIAISPLLEYFKEEDSDVRSAAASVLGNLAEEAELHGAIRDAIPSFVQLLKDEHWQARHGAISALGTLSEQAELRDALRIAISPLLECFKDMDSNVRSAAASALGKFTERAELRVVPHIAISPLLECLKDEDSDVRSAAASALGKLAEQAELRDALSEAIPSLVQLLKDAQWRVRHGVVSALGKFAEQAELCNALHIAISPLLECFKDEDSGVRSAAASVIGKLAEQAELHGAILDAIPSFVQLLKDEHWQARHGAVSALGKLSEQAELRDALHIAISPLLECFKDKNSNVRSAAASAFGKLAEQAELHGAIRDAIPSFVQLLKDEHWQTRHGAVSALGKLSEQAELRDALRIAISPLLECFKDKNFNVRSAAASAFGKLAEQAELRDAVLGVLPSIIELLTDTQFKVIALSVLGELAGVL